MICIQLIAGDHEVSKQMMLLLSNYQILKLLQIDALTSILIHFYAAFILQLHLQFACVSYHYHFYAKLCNFKYKLLHNSCLESIKMSILGRKLAKCQKVYEQILEHNRVKPNELLYFIKYKNDMHAPAALQKPFRLFGF